MTLAINDTALIHSFQQGDGQAFKVIYNHLVASVRMFVERLVDDRLAAEDITAEAFVRTFRKNADFSSFERIKAYLYISAHNAALDHIRNEKRHAEVHKRIRYLADPTTEDVEVAYIRAEASQAVQEAIEALPGKPREVIRMAFVDGKKLTEIAAKLNISYNTVQNHRARGLELIKMHLIKNRLLTTAGLFVALSFFEPH